MPLLKPIKITDQIATAVRERVLTCQFRPGDRLVEKTLCGEFGVSRTSLREALTVLAHEHIIDQIPNKGYRVPKLTLDRFRKVCGVRRVVEPEVAAIAAVRGTPEDGRALRNAAPFVPGHKDAELDSLLCIRRSRAFHDLVARAGPRQSALFLRGRSAPIRNRSPGSIWPSSMRWKLVTRSAPGR